MAATTEATPTIEAGLLKPKEAATRLGVSERTLRRITKPKGPLDCIRINGFTKRYSPADLDAYTKAVRNAPGPSRDKAVDAPSTATHNDGDG